MNNDYISVTDYAKVVGREASVIRRRILSGKLKAIKFGKTWLIPLSEVPKK